MHAIRHTHLMVVSVDSSCIVKRRKIILICPNTITVDFHLTSNSVSVRVWLVYIVMLTTTHARTHAILSEIKS